MGCVGSVLPALRAGLSLRGGTEGQLVKVNASDLRNQGICKPTTGRLSKTLAPSSDMEKQCPVLALVPLS